MYLRLAAGLSFRSPLGFKSIAAALLFGLAGFVAGCGGGGDGGSPPPAPTLTSISVAPSTASVAAGKTSAFTATGTYSDGSSRAVAVTWSSSAQSVATIGPNGVATALAVGSTSITATSGSISGAATLTVTAATLASISVTPATASIAVGTQNQFTATGVYTDGSKKAISVTWGSSAPAVATIGSTSGLATALAVGSTSITATSGSISGAATLTVTAATLASISVTPATASIVAGITQQFTATGVYTDGSKKAITVTWSSSAPAVATIAATTGLATAVAAGTATITASLGTVSGSAALTVTAPTLVSIAVTPVNPTVVTGTTGQLTATGTYSNHATENITAQVTWASSKPAVATISDASGTAGLATGVAAGTTTITATLGAVAAPAVTLSVTVGEYVYATNYSDGTVSQYTINTGGGLVPMTPATVPAGVNAYSIVVDPTQHFAYVTNFDSPGSVSEYTIGATGALTANGTVATGNQPNDITIDPSGRYAYVANYADGTVSQYVIQPDGTLAPNAAGATVPAAIGAAWVTVNAAATYAYVPNFVGNTVSVYSIGAGGALTPTSTATLAPGSNADSLAIDPTGAYAYVSNLYLNTIQLFDISPTDGSLTAPTGSTTSLPVGGNPREITVGGPAGNYLYVPNSASNQVWQFSIGAGGALTLLNTTNLAFNTGPNFIAIDATGHYAYVTDRGVVNTGPYMSTISQYSIGAAGLLTPLSTPTVPSGLQPACIVTATAY